MKFHYTQRKDCKAFWGWVSWSWNLYENRKPHRGWRFFGLTWDSDNQKG